MVYFPVFLCRNFCQSNWCIEEFKMAHAHRLMEKNNKYLIIIFAEDVNIDKLPRELKAYLRTHTYLDARNFQNNPNHPKYHAELDEIRKRLRFAMPGVTLNEFHRRQEDQQQQDEGQKKQHHKPHGGRRELQQKEPECAGREIELQEQKAGRG